MRLVESLGGEPVTLRGEDAAVETVRYARKRNVTKIVVGKPTHPRWRDVLKPSFLDDLVRQSGEIDVYVISGAARSRRRRVRAPEPGRTTPVRRPARLRRRRRGRRSPSTTIVAWFFFGRTQLADVVMVFLLGVVLVVDALRVRAVARSPPCSACSRSTSSSSRRTSASPSRTCSHIVTFGVMFLVAVVISHLTKRIRDQADSARGRERRTASLYAVSRELGGRQRAPGAARRRPRGTCARSSTSRSRCCCPGGDDELEIVHADEGTLGRRTTRTSASPTGSGTTSAPAGAGPTRSPWRAPSSSRSAARAVASASSRSSRRPSRASTIPTSGSSSTRIAGLIGSALERTAARRGGAARAASASRPSSSATRSSARSRTTCARRSASSPAPRARSSRTTCPRTTPMRRELLRRRTKRRCA